jgi:competence protein ComEC
LCAESNALGEFMKKFLLVALLLLATVGFLFAKGVSVFFLDVGQGDCELVKDGAHSVLIDAATEDMAPGIVSFLKSKGVSEISLLILTHPHADHIGGAVDIISAFRVESIYMPKVTTNTRVFERLLAAIKAREIRVHSPEPGESLALGDMTLVFLAPSAIDKANLNNDSIVSRVSCGKRSFLFMGDAERPEEEQLLAKGYELHSDVLKVGHHGSNSSTTDALLKAVKPSLAVIEVGIDNDYGHPSARTINRLTKTHNIRVLQTALNGTVEVVSDGETLDIRPER